jgi:1,2-dihydroxy-3-keto-5-methylthiopentene dioxygenase
MAVVRIPAEHRTITGDEAVRAALLEIGIAYERWEAARPVPPGAPAEELLAAYTPEIERLKAQGGYVTADVIDVSPTTPGLDAMLAKFSKEHWHDEDEVRYIVEGSGLFHVRPRGGNVHAIEVGPGDLIRVPRNTWHWFDLCATRRIRAIRLFQDASGWTPHYTGTAIETLYEPVCLGPAQIPPRL